MIESIFDLLNQDSQLGRIFANAISSLITDEISDKTFYKIFALVLFGNALIEGISDHNGFEKDQGLIKILPAKVQSVKDQLRTLKKPQNMQINTIEDLLNLMLGFAKHDIDKIREIQTWNHVLEYAFGKDIMANQSSAKSIEILNIKELLLRLQFEGPLIQSVFDRYDGIITFSMSLLTMLSGTEISNSLKDEMNQILEGIGNSGRIIVLQQRLRKNAAQREKFASQFEELKTRMLQTADAKSLPEHRPILNAFFGILQQLPRFEINFQPLPVANKIPGVDKIFGLSLFHTFLDPFTEIWENYRTNLSEIFRTLMELNEFLDSIIKKANKITGMLKLIGFQTALPLHDVESCEKAGIRLKDIISTAGGNKHQVPSKYTEFRQKLMDEYNGFWVKIQKILSKKAKEEDSLQQLDADSRFFRTIHTTMQSYFDEFNGRRAFFGVGEEIYLQIRELWVMNSILQAFLTELQPLESIPYNLQNLARVSPILQAISPFYMQFQKLGYQVLIFNSIVKKLSGMNRDFILRIGQEAQFVEQPIEIRKLIQDLPKVFVKEVQQKLISPEDQAKKTADYNEILEFLNQLDNISSIDRKIIVSLSEIAIR